LLFHLRFAHTPTDPKKLAHEAKAEVLRKIAQLYSQHNFYLQRFAVSSESVFLVVVLPAVYFSASLLLLGQKCQPLFSVIAVQHDAFSSVASYSLSGQSVRHRIVESSEPDAPARRRMGHPAHFL
jgi:hypothetical protein